MKFSKSILTAALAAAISLGVVAQETAPPVPDLFSNEALISSNPKGSLILLSKVLIEGCPTNDPMAILFLVEKEDPIYGCWHVHNEAVFVLWAAGTITMHKVEKFAPYALPTRSKNSPPPRIPKEKVLPGKVATL